MSLTVYKSSAGSGKTYTLVLEYLRLVLKNPLFYRNILAITFTNKAANEMKSRILKALETLASDNAENRKFQSELLENLKEPGQESGDLQKKADEVFHAILHHYSDFNIGTIDAFSHRIIQTFSRDLELPSLFEVEMESKQLFGKVVDELITKIGIDDFITNLLIGYLSDNLDDDLHWRIDRPLLTLVEILLSEDSFMEFDRDQEMDEKVFKEIREAIFKQILDFENQMADDAGKILALFQQADLTVNDFYNKSKGIHSVLLKLSLKNCEEAFGQKSFESACSQDFSFIGSKADKRIKSSYEGIKDAVFEHFNRIKLTYESSFKTYILCRLLRSNIYASALMPAVLNTLQELIERNQQVPISEFNKRIAALLQASSVPYIYERLGERFRSFLLDEFQDTSVLQWQNLLPLIENALAQGSKNLIVGDGKQSIYRFRGGEFLQFTELPKIYAHNNQPRLLQIEQSLIHHYQEKKLDTNYRSLRNVVEFNNDFFDFLSKNLDGFGELYFDSAQNSLDKNNGGYVQLNFFETPKGETSGWVREQIREKTLEIIHNLQQKGLPLGDITVLVRSNNDGDDIANYLNNNAIEVVSSDSLLLDSSTAVRLVINALKFTVEPNEAINNLEFLVNLGDLYPNGEINGSAFSFDLNELEHSYDLKNEVSKIIDIQSIDESLSLYDLSEELIRRLGLDAKPDPYIQFFLQHVFLYQSNLNAGKKGFFEYWGQERSQASVVVPENSAAVKIMTIHKAKGLEFPVVIYAFASMASTSSGDKFHWVDVSDLGLGKLRKGIVKNIAKLKNTRYSVLYKKEQSLAELDKANLMYVAFTRAAAQLYVLVNASSKSSKVNSFLKSYLEWKGEWSEDKKEYIFGEPIIPAEASADRGLKGFQTANALLSYRWTDHLRIAKLKSLRENTSKQLQALEYGNLLHLILSNIRYQDQIGAVLSNYYKLGLLGIAEQQELSQMLMRMTSDHRLANLFRLPAQVKTEAEIMDRAGRLFRIDRFVELPDEVVVLDYKTGIPHETHNQQIMHYVRIVEAVQVKKVRAILIYFKGLTDYEIAVL